MNNLDSDPLDLLSKFDWNGCLFLCSINIRWSEPKVYIARILFNFIFFSLGPKTVSESRVPKASRYRQRTPTVHHTLVGGSGEVDIVLSLLDVCISELELLTDIGGLLSLLAATFVITTPSSRLRSTPEASSVLTCRPRSGSEPPSVIT